MWRSGLKYQFAQRTCATSNIKPFPIGWRIEPGQELACDQAAPAPHVRLVRVATRPNILAFSSHGAGPDRHRSELIWKLHFGPAGPAHVGNGEELSSNTSGGGESLADSSRNL